MFTYYAELKLSELKFGEKKYYYSVVLWLSIVILALAATYPVHCLSLSKYGSHIIKSLTAITFLMILYGVICAQKLIIPKKLWGGVKLYVFTYSVVISFGYIGYLKEKLPMIDCSHDPIGTHFLLAAALLPLAAADFSYLITIYFKSKKRKREH